MTRMDRLIGHQFRIRPFKELTIPYQLAMTYYMAIDGEAWDLTCDCLGIVINVLPIQRAPRIKGSLHDALSTLPIRECEEKWARP